MQYQKTLQQHIDFIKEYITPATLDEIEIIEKEHGIVIPESLKEFFLLVGNDYNYLWEATGQARLGMAGHNRNLSIKLLNACEIILPHKCFVFSSYSDDQFLFVYLNEEDPAVYLFERELFYCGDDYKPGSSTWGLPKGVSKVADSFSKLVNEIVKEKINRTSGQAHVKGR